jgi:hypothetical protein
MRKVLGVLAGIVAAMVTITLCEFLSHAIAPQAPAPMDDPAALATYVERMPDTLKGLVVLGWFLGALVGGFVALRITGWSRATWFVAGAIALGGVFNALQLPSPVWMQIATVLAPALGGALALHLPWQRRAASVA